MKFYDALKFLEEGKKVMRRKWGPSGMYIKIHWPNPDELMTIPYIYLSTAQEFLIPWCPSQTDVLASDWDTKE